MYVECSRSMYTNGSRRVFPLQSVADTPTDSSVTDISGLYKNNELRQVERTISARSVFSLFVQLTSNVFGEGRPHSKAVRVGGLNADIKKKAKRQFPGMDSKSS
mmetsp:Transcript_32654/g.52108  ORF Transcript_32654/g.52108 Transcript_32654/m.52108 type:complete len:104 (-) Transcript_32654:1146-1457(-)